MTPQELAEWTAQSTAFSRALPGAQIAVNTSFLNEFKDCPRRYFLACVAGWQPLGYNVHLQFGILVHEALEMYWKLRSLEHQHDAALAFVVHDTLRKTWDRERSAPQAWLTQSRSKNRHTLLIAIIGYLDKRQDDDAKTVMLSNGKPATELTFRFASGYRLFSTGEQIDLCGTIDRLVDLSGSRYVKDYKTTEKPLDRQYISSFTPGGQASQYTLAGEVAYEFDVKGVLIDAIRVNPSGGLDEAEEFMRFPVPRSRQALAEWHHDLGKWLKRMEACALEAQGLSDVSAAWEQNDHQCTRCQFQGVCSVPPGADRERALRAGFRQRHWDPLARRTEV